jgi:hypothetical protein
MLCQKCQQEQATAHISEKLGDQLLSDDWKASSKLHFCEACYEQWQSEKFARIFPPGRGLPITEKLRVIESSPERTIVRLVRTESQPAPEDWIFLTARLPEKFCVVGMEFKISAIPPELEYLKGNRDSM